MSETTETLKGLRGNSPETPLSYISPHRRPGERKHPVNFNYSIYVKQEFPMGDLLETTLIDRSFTIRGGSHREQIHPAIEALISIFDTLAAWIERNRQRRALDGLPDYLLKDIGVSRVEARMEAGKPFWQA